MRIAICDDDRALVAILTTHIEAWSKKTGQPVHVMHFESAENFLLHWTTPAMFDLLFLGTKMKKMTGIELAEIIRKDDAEMAIVFVTADKDFVLQGYEVNALNYLIKPISEVDCAKCLSKVRERLINRDTSALVIQLGGKLKRIRYDQIMYLESVQHYLHIHTVKDQLRYRKNISDAEVELKGIAEFIRIHRSYLANLRYITSVEDNSVILENEDILPVSRKYWQSTYRAFMGYYENSWRRKE